MNLRISFVIALMLWLSACDNILMVLDSTQLEKTHTKLISMLKSAHNVEIAYSFGKSKIELKTYDRFKYDHVIVMCLSAKCIICIIQKVPVKLKLMILSPTSMRVEMLQSLEILTLKSPLESSSMPLEFNLMNSYFSIYLGIQTQRLFQQ